MRVTLLCVLLAASPAYAFEDKALAQLGQPEAAATVQPAPDRKICKRVAASESRMAAKRVCMTAEQWKKAAADAEL